MKKVLLTIMTLLILCGLAAQGTDDWLWEDGDSPQEDPLDSEFIKVHYEQKNARLAMLMSALVPGAGQFYADKSALTTYIFPVIEIGMIAGILVFQKKGDDKTKDYERYANQEIITYTLGDGTEIQTTRYDRDRQRRVESILKDLNTVDIYNTTYFRLEDENTQHFYEDIGKYSQYVFGWADWYYVFATDEHGADANPIWYPGGHDTDPPDPEWIWRGNYRLWGDPQNIPIENNTHASSSMRKKYVQMRNASKDEYFKAHLFTFGLALNHIGSSLDAVRVTRNVNRGAIADSGLKMHYYTDLRDGFVTPSLGFGWKF